MMNIEKLLLVFSWILLSSFQTENVEMADGLRANGLIYVVVIVIVIIVAGLLGYLFTIDKKISKLEKESSKTKKE